jgi:hypothetical protein
MVDRASVRSLSLDDDITAELGRARYSPSLWPGSLRGRGQPEWRIRAHIGRFGRSWLNPTAGRGSTVPIVSIATTAKANRRLTKTAPGELNGPVTSRWRLLLGTPAPSGLAMYAAALVVFLSSDQLGPGLFLRFRRAATSGCQRKLLFRGRLPRLLRRLNSRSHRRFRSVGDNVNARGRRGPGDFL